jgi:hypothetical protein
VILGVDAANFGRQLIVILWGQVMKKFPIAVSLLGAALMLLGCGSSQPECASSDAKKLLSEVLTENMTKGPAGTLVKSFELVSISNIRPTKIDKETKSSSCAASVHYKAELGPLKLDRTKDIKYTVQINSEGKLYVETELL